MALTNCGFCGHPGAHTTLMPASGGGESRGAPAVHSVRPKRTLKGPLRQAGAEDDADHQEP